MPIVIFLYKMACHATIAASTATGQQERSISWPKLPTPLPSIPANPATPARAKVSEIRSTSAANISALTTAMPPRNMPLSLRTRAFPCRKNAETQKAPGEPLGSTAPLSYTHPATDYLFLQAENDSEPSFPVHIVWENGFGGVPYAVDPAAIFCIQIPRACAPSGSGQFPPARSAHRKRSGPSPICGPVIHPPGKSSSATICA